MPNWCSNNVTISGPKEKISELWNKAKSNESGLLEAMVPIGEWEYGKASETWGTKWDINLEGLEYEEADDGTACIGGWFESAWSPPLAAFQKYCAENADIDADLSFFEPGVGFVGEWNSTTLEEEVYDIDPENLDEIPLALREEFDLENWYDMDEFEEKEDEP
jgi:hypothetical protein